MVCLTSAVAIGVPRDGHAQGYRVVKGLSFSQADPSLTLDLYLPKATSAQPCVIVIQGGGFRPQNGQRFRPIAEHLASRGFCSALISYRGRPQHHFRETLADVKDSVRFVRRNGAKYGIDPDRIGAVGRSAGGTLAALLAVTSDAEDDESRIQAAVGLAGVYDFVSRFSDADQLELQPDYRKKIESNGEWIGAAFSPSQADWREASPIAHVDSEDPPILFCHSKNDSTVPWIQSAEMHRAMRQAGVSSELKIFETGGHRVAPEGKLPLETMTDFFKRRL
ncbi:alpha/beta hydrolase [Roseiconus nitratireducens]|nr:alpha/beta hydrolase [Roseiconus nitratireducens]